MDRFGKLAAVNRGIQNIAAGQLGHEIRPAVTFEALLIVGQRVRCKRRRRLDALKGHSQGQNCANGQRDEADEANGSFRRRAHGDGGKIQPALGMVSGP